MLEACLLAAFATPCPPVPPKTSQLYPDITHSLDFDLFHLDCAASHCWRPTATKKWHANSHLPEESAHGGHGTPPRWYIHSLTASVCQPPRCELSSPSQPAAHQAAIPTCEEHLLEADVTAQLATSFTYLQCRFGSRPSHAALPAQGSDVAYKNSSDVCACYTSDTASGVHVKMGTKRL